VIHNLSIAWQRFLRYTLGGWGIHGRGAPWIRLGGALLVSAQRARWLLLQFSHDFVSCLILAPLANRVHASTSWRRRLRTSQPFILNVRERHVVHHPIFTVGTSIDGSPVVSSI
jgi:hypothetical protein